MREKTVINLIKMFKAGPEVSLNGSPTVSPTTHACREGSEKGALKQQERGRSEVVGLCVGGAGDRQAGRPQGASCTQIAILIKWFRQSG